MSGIDELNQGRNSDINREREFKLPSKEATPWLQLMGQENFAICVL